MAALGRLLLIAEDRRTLDITSRTVHKIVLPEVVGGATRQWSREHPAETHRVDAFYIVETFDADGIMTCSPTTHRVDRHGTMV